LRCMAKRVSSEATEKYLQMLALWEERSLLSGRYSHGKKVLVQ